ncbi:SAM-dependent methyltransferase [Actinomadura fibrosa]|uniref:SAM-dependent methyltransferase n=1 Tax=Actinomadura fibrosa TaxID=111802 RepID=A0ABW2XWR0_9ACTN|nr:SAM-dependent methyltransferase [Actinomadura fibrosa]
MSQLVERAAERADPHVLPDEEAAALLGDTTWRRFAVLGDSLAAGVLEATPGYAPVSWADRLHGVLRRIDPGVAYLNLGRRGLTARQVRATQLDRALDFRPDLAALVCGGNDVLAPSFDPGSVHDDVDAQVKALTGAGATVFLYGLMDIAKGVPELARIRPRLADLNALVLEVARRHGALYVDLWDHAAAGDRDLYSSDLLHMSARGHAHIAALTVRALADRTPPAARDAVAVAVPRPGWAPDEADVERPSIARMYDYLLGGTRHTAADRAVAHAAVAAAPGIRLTLWENRKFIKRAVRYAVGRGVDQILDIGSGIPARGAVHEVARRTDPSVRVVYADTDPVAVERGAELLAGTPGCASVRGDLTEPGKVLALPEVASLLDLDRPVALLLVNVLHFVDPDLVGAALAEYRDRLAPGSLLAITHGTADGTGATDGAADGAASLSDVYAGAYGHMTMRTRDEVTALFGDFTLVPPGVVDLPDWRPAPSPLSARLGGRAGSLSCYAAVGVKGPA